MEIYLKGHQLKLLPSQAIGKGGEADIYKINHQTALKLFKPPSHPDYYNQPLEQQLAKERLLEHQYKLPLFPKNVPKQVIVPQELVTDTTGKNILGYTMQLLTNSEVLMQYGNRSYRSKSGITNQTIISIFQQLYQIVSELHQQKIIIGDFNDLNILVQGNNCYLIDADSFQFSNFPCRVYTAKFVDPLLCDPNQNRPILIQNHNANSDWYALAILLMQSLLFVDPYGGVYKPSDPSKKIPHEARSLHRITIFNPEVKYPKPAIPYQVLSDDLLHEFTQIFHQDQRRVFPRTLLDNLNFKQCNLCGMEHARLSCPSCTTQIRIISPPIVKSKTLQSSLIFETQGVILCGVSNHSQLYYLYHFQGEFFREDHQSVLSGNLDPLLKIRILGTSTLIGKQHQLIILNRDHPPSRKAIADFEVNTTNCYWTLNGQLYRDGEYGPVYIGDILEGQTKFWVGSDLGFGFYQASNLNVAFLFDPARSGINDQIKFPFYSGKLIESNCFFSRDYCWLFYSTQTQIKTEHCLIINRSGQIASYITSNNLDYPWLNPNGGKYATHNLIFIPTDEGIIRVQLNNNLIETKLFPETESFVNSSSQLLPAKGGFYVVNQHQIMLLVLSS